MRSARNTLRVFEAIATRQPVALPAVAEAVGLPTTTAHRAIATLADAGWITPTADGTRRWAVAPQVVRLVTGGEHPLRAAAAPVCAELRDRCGESVSLSVPDGDEIVVIGHWDGTGTLRVVQAEGTRAPMAVASTGKAYLAHLDPAARAARLAALRPAGASPRELEHEVEMVRARGWAVVDREWLEGVAQVGAAIVCDGTPVGGIGIALAAYRLDPATARRLGEQLRVAADEVAARVASSDARNTEKER